MLLGPVDMVTTGWCHSNMAAESDFERGTTVGARQTVVKTIVIIWDFPAKPLHSHSEKSKMQRQKRNGFENDSGTTWVTKLGKTGLVFHSDIWTVSS